MEAIKLPSGWRSTTLGLIARQDGYGLVDGPFGSNLPSSDYVQLGVPVIRGSNLSLGTVRFQDEQFVYVSKETAKRLERSLCQPKDIIFTKKGTLGQVGIIPREARYSHYLISSNQMKLSVDEHIADPLYVYYFVVSPASREKIIRDSEVTGVPKTNLAYLRKFPIALPPLSEQHAIAHILGSLDDKIELNRQMNETLEGIARALFKSWFVDFDPVRAKMEGRELYGMDVETAALFPDGFEDSTLGAIPRGWRVATVGDATRVVGGSTPSTKESAYWDEGTIHWATPKDLSSLSNAVLIGTERCITESGLQQISSGLLPKGTVLLSSRAPIGYLAITAIPVAINQGFIALICEKELSNHYILQWLRFNMDVIKGRANGTTFLEISKANFRPLPLIVPSNPILKIFNQQASNVYEMLVSNLEQNQTLTALRDTLLPKLLSGAIRVNDAERAVEARV